MSLEEIYKAEQAIRSPLKTFRVKSRTNRNPDTGELLEYRVGLWGDETFTCECMWGQRGNKKKLCYHAERVKENLIKMYGSLDKAIEYFRSNK
jgi:phosphoenolpyruvate-protein kinase (PTS system EI component)